MLQRDGCIREHMLTAAWTPSTWGGEQGEVAPVAVQCRKCWLCEDEGWGGAAPHISGASECRTEPCHHHPWVHPSPYLSVHPLSVHPTQGHSGVPRWGLLHPGVFRGILRCWHCLEMQLKPQPFRRVLRNAVERKPAGLNGNLIGFWSNF